MADRIEVLARLLAQAGSFCTYNGASVNPYGVGFGGYDDMDADMQSKLKMQALWLSDLWSEANKTTPQAMPSKQDISNQNGIPGRKGRKQKVIE